MSEETPQKIKISREKIAAFCEKYLEWSNLATANDRLQIVDMLESIVKWYNGEQAGLSGVELAFVKDSFFDAVLKADLTTRACLN